MHGWREALRAEPEDSLLRWGLFVVAVGGVLIGTGPAAIATIGEWLVAHQESLPWYASRLLGFLAYCGLAASVIYGLLLSTGSPRCDRSPRRLVHAAPGAERDRYWR